MEGLSCFVGEQVPRGYIRCDFFIVTHCVIIFDVISELSTLRNGVFRRSKITQDGRTVTDFLSRCGNIRRPASCCEDWRGFKEKKKMLSSIMILNRVRMWDVGITEEAFAYRKLRRSTYHHHHCQPEMMGILMRRKMRTTPTHMRVMVFWSIRCDV